ncbi:hypothetical protein B0H34DRAFT_473777 [Crassisporium funariophilum]|nr:hypothetical protein B0H34DRAFT_473777 [Crassisporium funariophilum]
MINLVLSSSVQSARYFDIASLVLLIYDTCLTFDLEVDYVWFAPISAFKVLYFLSRYSIFISLLYIWQTFGTTFSGAEACNRLFTFNAWMLTFGFGITEMILTVRLCAVWGMNRTFNVMIGTFFAMFMIGVFIIVSVFLHTVQYEPAVDGIGCFMASGSRIISLTWIFMMAYDALTLLLMMIPAYTLVQQGHIKHLWRMKLTTVVYRDGIIYYFFLCVASLLNVIVIFVLPTAYMPLILMPERVLHTILTSRLVLDTRQAGKANQESLLTLSTFSALNNPEPSS